MNIKDRLIHLATVLVKDRMLGRTTLNAKMAKESGGMVIAADFKEAKRIEEVHGVPTRSMETNLEGYSAPFYMDHHATSRMFIKAATKIENLENEQKKLIQVLDKHLGQQATNEILREIGISELRAYK